MRIKIGVAEMELLRYVHDQGAMSVKEIFQGFGMPKGYTRGTIVRMVERLQKKGFLRREDVDNVFRYSSTQPPGDVEGKDPSPADGPFRDRHTLRVDRVRE